MTAEVDLRLLVAVAALVVVLVLAAVLLSSAARRLDRLHRRVDGARAALDGQLLRRAAAADHLAATGLLDPASSVLLAACAAEATDAADAPPADTSRLLPGADPPPELRVPAPGVLGEARERAESDLSAALRAALDAETVAELRTGGLAEPSLEALTAACHRCQLARRFHNDAVTQARRVRRGRVVRWARLAGHAPDPRTFEIDDVPPPALLPR